MLFMHYKSGVIFLCIILVLGVVPVFASLDYTTQKSKTTTITESCFNSNTSNGHCSPSAVCTINLADTNRNVIVNNQSMTLNVNYFFYNTSNLSSGIYSASIICSDQGINGFDTIMFGVNEAGTDYRDSGTPWLIIGVLAIISLILIVTTYFLTNELKLAFFLLTILMITITIWTARYFAVNSFSGDSLLSILDFGLSMSMTAFVASIFYCAWQLMMGLKIEKRPEYGAKIYQDKSKNKGGRY